MAPRTMANGRTRLAPDAHRRMKLTCGSGRALELVVVQYEHPDVAEGLWESNWLVVSGRVSDGIRSWRFAEPCVTTFELADLADWFDAVAAGQHDRSTFTFAEPNLEFAYAPEPRSVLTARFRGGSAPDALDAERRATGVSVELELGAGELRAAAAELRDMLLDYPIRGGAA